MDKINTPRFLSPDFHIRFFPALLRGRLKLGERTGTGFPSIFEFHIAFVFCLILLVIGIPFAVSSNAAFGWAMAGIGAAGILALLIHSISSRKDPPSYDCFLIGVFSFFVFLGATAGVFVGTLHHSLPLGLLVGLGGLIAGYLLGILAGLWFQCLGWLASIVNFAAALVVLGMFLVDVLLLSGSILG